MYVKNFRLLTSNELLCAVICRVSLIQRAEFSSERKSLPHDSKLLSLNLFLDSNDIIGGRLSSHTLLSYILKHTMLMPKNQKEDYRLLPFN